MGKKLSRKGFSLIEVLIAIGVVATGVMALMAVFITGTRSNQHGQDLSRATFYARKVTEIIRANGLAFTTGTIPPNASSGINDPVGTFRPLNAEPAKFSNILLPKVDLDGNPILDAMGDPIPDPADEKFERSIQIARASLAPSDYNYNILKMDVTIRWVGGKVGDGKRKVQISSMLKSGGS